MNVKVSITSDERMKIRINDYRGNYQFENLKTGEYFFRSSTCYGLIGEVGSGNWALSYLLTGWSKPNSSKIFIDGLDTPINTLRNVSCYVGHSHYYDIEPFHKHMSVRKSIEMGIRKSHNNSVTFQNLKSKFDLSAERVDRKFDRIGNEHWRASLAIGYAYNKKIYCSPFLECSQWEKYYSIMLEKWLKVLKNDGAIILIPTDDEKCISKVIDNTYYF